MENQIKPWRNNSDFLSQSYNDGVERIVGFKHTTEFTVSKKVLKKRQQFWDDLCTTYSRQFSSDFEYNISTFKRCKSLSFVQYWINTGYLPYKALLEEATNPESDMSFIEESLNSSFHDSEEEKSNEYHARLSYDESSLSSSIDTTAYILSNMNTTNKVETMAILEGAKHDASPNRKNCGNVETVQFQKTMLDNNGNAYQAALPTSLSKPTESSTQQTNNLHKNIIQVRTNSVNTDNTSNCTSEHDGELFNAKEARAFNASRKSSDGMYDGQRSMVDESSMLGDNTSKLSSRKKLYCGRNSPVDLVDTTSRNKIVPINSTKYLHPALAPICRTSRKFSLYRKRQRNHFSFLNTSKLNRSIVSISSYRKRKRKKTARSNVSENSSIMHSSKKRGISVADKAENNPTKNKSFTESTSSKELSNMESKLDNSVGQVEKSDNGCSQKSNRASRTYLKPRIYLRPLTKRDIQKYRSSKKTTASLRSLKPVVRLIGLSDSDIKKYRKPNGEATRPGTLSPITQLNQSSDSDIEKYRKPNKEASGPSCLSPIPLLKLLSDSDIEKYRKPNGEATESGSLSPITQLKEPSDSDIEKYRKPNKEARGPSCLSPIPLLKQLSDSDIEKYKKPNQEATGSGSLSPITQLKEPSDSDIEKCRKPNREARRPNSLSPITLLKPLSDSDIEKYRKPNGEAIRSGNLSPMAQLKQPTEFNNSERKKSQDALDVRFRHPVVRLKKLSEQDIKKYKAECVRSEYSDTAYVPRNSSKCSNISQPGSNVVHLIIDSDSDTSQESSQPSSSIVGVSKNRNLVRQDTSNKYTGSNNSALNKTSETAQNRFCRSMVIDSSSNSSRSGEGRSPRKNLETSVSSLKTSKSRPPEEGVRQNGEVMSCSDESEIFSNKCPSNGAYAGKKVRRKRRSHYIVLSDEDDEFANLVCNSKKSTNSQIRSPYNSSEMNSDAPVEIRSIRKCRLNAMEAKFKKQTAYFFRKRSKNLLYLNNGENINCASPVSITRSSLSTASRYGSNESLVAGKSNLLTSMNVKRDKSRLHTLRFQTKILDSDSETSFLS